MPTLELAAGQVVTAAHTNTYWMRQVIATGLSSARPTPYEGRAVYDTDADALMIYTTAATGWRPPWNLPWGYVDSCETQFDTTQSNTDVTLISMTIQVVEARLYRIQGMARCSYVAGVSPNVGTVHWYPGFAGGPGALTPARSNLLMGQGADFGTTTSDKVLPFSNIYRATASGSIQIQGRAWSAALVAKWYVGCWVDVDDIGPAMQPP